VDGVIQPVLELDVDLVRPDALFQLLPGHHLTRVLEEESESAEGPPRETELAARLPKLSGPGIELEWAESIAHPTILAPIYRQVMEIAG